MALAVIQILCSFCQLAKMANQLDQHVLNPETAGRQYFVPKQWVWATDLMHGLLQYMLKDHS